MVCLLLKKKKVIVTTFIRKQERSKSAPTFTNLYVKDLNGSVDNKTLEKFFSTYGKVTSCLITVDKDGKSRQFGFINFEKPQSAKDSIDNLNGKVIEGISAPNKTLYVGKAEKKEDRVKKLKEEHEKKKLKQFKNIKV